MKQKIKKPKEKYKFIFPNFMSKIMKDVSMRTQLESSLISMSLIMISLTLMVIYLLFFGEGSWAYKILILINLLAGFLFISSFLMTTYQQYISYMQTMGFDPQKERQDVLKRGRLGKRIKLAMKERKKVKKKEKEDRKPRIPYSTLLNTGFVDEALERKDKIDEQKAKDFKELQKVANKLEQENTNELKGGPKK